MLRLHQEDFCQALGRMPDRKYESRGGPTLSDMMRLIGQQSSDRDDDRLALSDFLIINLVAGAPDGHAKNISMLRTTGMNWVAPLYDLATGLAYDTDGVERTVALSVGGERQLSRIYAKQWDKAARTLGLPEEAVRARVAQLAGGFSDAYESALADIGEAPGADETAERSLPVLRAHCDQVLARL